jgi:hypothetical protein
MTVRVLRFVQWEFLGLSDEEQREVGQAIDRLEREALPRSARLVGRTKRLYSWRRGDVRILFVKDHEGILVLTIRNVPRELPERLWRPRDGG